MPPKSLHHPLRKDASFCRWAPRQLPRLGLLREIEHGQGSLGAPYVLVEGVEDVDVLYGLAEGNSILRGVDRPVSRQQSNQPPADTGRPIEGRFVDRVPPLPPASRREARTGRDGSDTRAADAVPDGYAADGCPGFVRADNRRIAFWARRVTRRMSCPPGNVAHSLDAHAGPGRYLRHRYVSVGRHPPSGSHQRRVFTPKRNHEPHSFRAPSDRPGTAFHGRRGARARLSATRLRRPAGRPAAPRRAADLRPATRPEEPHRVAPRRAAPQQAVPRRAVPRPAAPRPRRPHPLPPGERRPEPHPQPARQRPRGRPPWCPGARGRRDGGGACWSGGGGVGWPGFTLMMRKRSTASVIRSRWFSRSRSALSPLNW